MARCHPELELNMATKILKFNDANDIVRIGSATWDDSDNYEIYTYGGNDEITTYIDGWAKIDAGDGNDTIAAGGSGVATVYGGAGDDWLSHYGNSFDDGVVTLYGGDGVDVLNGLDGALDVLDGGAGNDLIVAGLHNMAIGGTGDDRYHINVRDEYAVTVVEQAGGGFDQIEANFDEYHFRDFIESYEMMYTKDFKGWGNAQANTFIAADGNDSFVMGDGADTVWASGGNDTIKGDAGNDVLDGARGNDLIYGGAGNDVLLGGHTYSQDWAWDDDTIYGGDGNDSIDGGFGGGVLHGEAGDDTMATTAGYATMYGGIGNDTYRVGNNHAQIVELANEGIDRIDFYGGEFTMPANVEHLGFIDNPRGTYYNFEGTSTITGNALANAITGNEYVNVVDGMSGADTLSGGGGNDTLRGGEQNDRVYGDSGNDMLYGDAGYDTVYGGDGADLMYGGSGNDELGGNAGADYMLGDAGNDIIYAGADADIAMGGDGYDTVYGESGNDQLRGGTMTDYLYGGDGNDRLLGEGSNDLLYGGAGLDTFVLTSTADSNIATGIDRIMDFAAGDRIDLSAIDAHATQSGNQAFSWGGMSYPGAGHAGTAWGQLMPANGLNPAFVRIYGDTNGDGTADFSIDVLGVTQITAADMVL